MSFKKQGYPLPSSPNSGVLQGPGPLPKFSYGTPILSLPLSTSGGVAEESSNGDKIMLCEDLKYYRMTVACVVGKTHKLRQCIDLLPTGTGHNAYSR